MTATEYAYVPSYGGEAPLVWQINLSTNRIVSTFDLTSGNLPYPTAYLDNIAITPDYKYIFVTNRNHEIRNGNIVSKIELSSGKVTNIQSDYFQGPRCLAVTPDGKNVIITNYYGNEIVIIDSTSNALSLVDKTIYAIDYTKGIAITPDGSKAFIGGKSQAGEYLVYVLDIKKNKLINAITSGSFQEPASIAINPQGTFAYVCNLFSSTLSVVDTHQENWVYDIKGFQQTLYNGIEIGPQSIGISSNGTAAYVTDGVYGGGYLYYVDLTKGADTMPQQIDYPTDSVCYSVAFNATGSQMYTVDNQNSKVVVSTRTNTVVDLITGFSPGALPSSIAIKPVPPRAGSVLEKALRNFSLVTYQQGM